MFDLQNKTAVVTGASRGIGRAIALKLAQNGADVAVIYSSNQQKAQDVVDIISSMGRKCSCYQCDIADFAKCKETVTTIIDDLGGIDILVNNAGIIRDKLVFSMSYDDFNQVIQTNLIGTFNMVHHSYMHFVKRKSGRIINISSVIGTNGNVGQANYAASKAGIIGFSKSVAKELASKHVTCNIIAPGYIETDMTDSINDIAKQKILSTIPMNQVGSPDHIANTALFLASDEASYITGEVIKVDGGLTI